MVRQALPEHPERGRLPAVQEFLELRPPLEAQEVQVAQELRPVPSYCQLAWWRALKPLPEQNCPRAAVQLMGLRPG